MAPIATYFVGDIAEMLDENNGITLNGVAVWVSEDAETVYVYKDGYFERLSDGRYFLLLENQGIHSHDFKHIENLFLSWEG